MMVKATPTAAFIVTETKFLLEFEIISLDPPAKFGLIDHTFERDVGGQCGKPVVIRFGFTLRPLDQQPFFSRRLAPPGVVIRHIGWADPKNLVGVSFLTFYTHTTLLLGREASP